MMTKVFDIQQIENGYFILFLFLIVWKTKRKIKMCTIECVNHKCIHTIKILCLNKNWDLRNETLAKFTSILLSETLKLNVYFLMCVCYYSTKGIAGNILLCKLKKIPRSFNKDYITFKVWFLFASIYGIMYSTFTLK